MYQAFVAVLLAVLATSNLFVPNVTESMLADPTAATLALGALCALNAWIADRGYVGTPHTLCVFGALTFLPGVLSAATHEYGQTKVLGLAMTLVMVLVMMQLLAHPAIRDRLPALFAIFGVLVAVALISIGETSTFPGRTSVAGMNPIGLGRMAALGALLCLLSAIWRRGLGRLVVLAAAAVSVYGASLTGSRAPLLAAGVALAVALLVNRRSGSKLVRLTGVLAIAGGVYLVFASGGIDSQSRLTSTDSSGRDSLWSQSLELASSTPAGIGFGNLYGHIGLSASAETTGVTQYSHNIFLETAVEGGWIALAGLTVLLVVAGRGLVAGSTTPNGAMLLAVGVFALVNANASSDLVGNRLLWAMIATGLGVRLWQVRGGREETADGAVATASTPAIAPSAKARVVKGLTPL